MKKFALILIAAAIMLTSIPAMAATPSKTTEDLTRVTSVQSEKGTLTSAIIWAEQELSETAQKQLDAITVFLKKDDTVMDFFTTDVKTEITALLPKDTDLSSLKLNDLISLGIGDYQVSNGNITATFQFPTAFTITQTVIAMVGYLDNAGVLVWEPIQTTIENGNLKLVFPEELMTVIQSGSVLAIFAN